MAGLRRSDSAKTTLSMYVSRTTKYQRWLAIINVVLMVVSLLMIFVGNMMTSIYHMDNLDFVSHYFSILPWSMIAVGVGTLLAGTAGFLFVGSESRPALMCYAGIVAVLALFKIGIVFCMMETRSMVRDKEILHQDHQIAAYNSYQENASVRAAWDKMHQRLRCCGARNFLDHSIKQSPTNLYECVPPSCCITGYREGSVDSCVTGGLLLDCNRGEATTLWDKIYVGGCLTILQDLYEKDLELNLLVYGILGVILVMLEVVGVAMASAYVAQIGRKQKQWLSKDNAIGSNRIEAFAMEG